MERSGKEQQKVIRRCKCEGKKALYSKSQNQELTSSLYNFAVLTITELRRRQKNIY